MNGFERLLDVDEWEEPTSAKDKWLRLSPKIALGSALIVAICIIAYLFEFRRSRQFRRQQELYDAYQQEQEAQQSRIEEERRAKVIKAKLKTMDWQTLSKEYSMREADDTFRSVESFTTSEDDDNVIESVSFFVEEEGQVDLEAPLALDGFSHQGCTGKEQDAAQICVLNGEIDLEDHQALEDSVHQGTTTDTQVCRSNEEIDLEAPQARVGVVHQECTVEEEECALANASNEDIDLEAPQALENLVQQDCTLDSQDCEAYCVSNGEIDLEAPQASEDWAPRDYTTQKQDSYSDQAFVSNGEIDREAPQGMDDLAPQDYINEDQDLQEANLSGDCNSSSMSEESESERSDVGSDRTKGEEDDCCYICLVDFESQDQVAVSNNARCRHLFHEECISSWLLKHDGCPVCRQQYLVELESDPNTLEQWT